jgi:hypothetical protein
MHDQVELGPEFPSDSLSADGDLSTLTSTCQAVIPSEGLDRPKIERRSQLFAG